MSYGTARAAAWAVHRDTILSSSSSNWLSSRVRAAARSWRPTDQPRDSLAARGKTDCTCFVPPATCGGTAPGARRTAAGTVRKRQERRWDVERVRVRTAAAAALGRRHPGPTRPAGPLVVAELGRQVSRQAGPSPRRQVHGFWVRSSPVNRSTRWCDLRPRCTRGPARRARHGAPGEGFGRAKDAGGQTRWQGLPTFCPHGLRPPPVPACAGRAGRPPVHLPSRGTRLRVQPLAAPTWTESR